MDSSLRSDDALAEALRASQRAVEADVQGNIECALREYGLALTILQQVLLGMFLSSMPYLPSHVTQCTPR